MMGRQDLVICSIFLGSILVMQMMTFVWRLALDGEFSDLSLAKLAEQYSKDYAWLIKLCLNCFGYLTVFLPALLIFKYTKATQYIDRKEAGYLSKMIRCCFYGSGECDSHGQLLPTTTNQDSPADLKHKSKRTAYNDCILLTYCFFGLMVSYLIWGVLQEKIMTQEYVHVEGDKEVRAHFGESQFLVFANRMLAFVIAGVYLVSTRKTSAAKHQAPLYKYSLSSITNILSAWFQYEALKYVNFPTQVLAKSCKIIPVMIMGKIVSRTKYQFYEYLTAGLISLGMILFMTGSADESKASAVTTLTGVFLLCMYMASDSFNSNWQSELFKSYKMSSVQMMFGVNMFSCLFTASSLSVQSGFLDSIEFGVKHPAFVSDCLLLSVSAAVGQLFIFYTIGKFGPVVFTIIMTLRQAFAILLSCLIYHHQVSLTGIIGISVVFLAISLRVYCNQRLRRNRSPAAVDEEPLISSGTIKS